MAISPALAKKIAEAKTSGARGDRITDGEYVHIVDALICDQMFSGTNFIPELIVLEPEKIRDDVEPNKKGSTVSCAWPVDGSGPAGEAAKGNIKQFICALFDIPESDQEKFIEHLLKYSGPKGSPESTRARGMVIHTKTRRSTIKTGKNAGKEGCFPHFTHLSKEQGNSEAEIAERRKEIESKK